MRQVVFQTVGKTLQKVTSQASESLRSCRNQKEKRRGSKENKKKGGLSWDSPGEEGGVAEDETLGGVAIKKKKKTISPKSQNSKLFFFSSSIHQNLRLKTESDLNFLKSWSFCQLPPPLCYQNSQASWRGCKRHVESLISQGFCWPAGFHLLFSSNSVPGIRFVMATLPWHPKPLLIPKGRKRGKIVVIFPFWEWESSGNSQSRN